MRKLITIFIAGFLNFSSMCWIAYTFYTFFWKHFHQKQVKNGEIVEIEEVYEEKKQVKNEEVVEEEIEEIEEVKERETEDPHSKILEILDRMNEEEHRQQELALARWRRFKNRFYTDSAFKELRRSFKERFFEDSELTAEYSEEEEANLQFWYDQWILLENYLFGKRDNFLYIYFLSISIEKVKGSGA